MRNGVQPTGRGTQWPDTTASAPRAPLSLTSQVGQLVDLPAVFRDCVSLVEWPERLSPTEAQLMAGHPA